MFAQVTWCFSACTDVAQVTPVFWELTRSTCWQHRYVQTEPFRWLLSLVPPGRGTHLGWGAWGASVCLPVSRPGAAIASWPLGFPFQWLARASSGLFEGDRAPFRDQLVKHVPYQRKHTWCEGQIYPDSSTSQSLWIRSRSVCLPSLSPPSLASSPPAPSPSVPSFFLYFFVLGVCTCVEVCRHLCLCVRELHVDIGYVPPHLFTLLLELWSH